MPHTHKKNGVKGKCCICLENITNQAMAILGCGHKFHLFCINEVIVKSPQYNLCPTCRNEFQTPNLLVENEKKINHILKENEELKASLTVLHQEVEHIINDKNNIQNNLTDSLEQVD